MSCVANSSYSFRKWLGAILLLIEVFTASATIYGFSAFFNVLAQHNIYEHYCKLIEVRNSTSKPMDCAEQMKQYQVNRRISIYFVTDNLSDV